MYLAHVANEFHLDVAGQSETWSFRHGAKLIYRHVIECGIVLDSSHVSLKRLRGVAIVSQVMPLPDTCRLLEVLGAHLVVAVGLGLLQVALLEEFFDEE